MQPLDFIDETLRLAGAELKTRFGGQNNVRAKKDTSLVTDADLAAEKIVLDRIAKYFPEDAIISEESGYHRVSRAPGQYVWIVDPLDGTTNFANGFPFFCTSIARCQFTADGHIQSVAGGVGDPIHDSIYLAARGAGATKNGARMSVHPDRALEQSFLVTGFYYTKGDDLDREINRFRKVAQSCQSIRRDGAAALDLALVASGVYDCFWERGLAVWDIAAGNLLVSEAGGRILNYPAADSASLVRNKAQLSYNLEADGIIAGSSQTASSIYEHLI